MGQRYRRRYTFLVLIRTYTVFDIDVRPFDILIVAKYDNGIHLLKSFLLFTSGDGNVSRKFELDDSESEEADSEVHFKFGRQSEIALACKYSRFSGRLSRQTIQQLKTQRRLYSQASYGVAYTPKK